MASPNMSDSTAFALANTSAETDATGDTEAHADAHEPRSFLQPGARIKHYEIIRQLGEGGMGAVYLARDTRLGRRVAIKFLHDRSGPALDRFLVEARATALCQHENIVVIYDVDDVRGDPYMVLEFIEGRALRDVLREQFEQDKPSVRWVIETMLQVARALAAAHAMHIVHRDLKPENILLSNNGLVKVVDFGIAKQLDTPMTMPDTGQTIERVGNVKLTQDGVTPGTMMYMAPEQWLADEIDGRTDIWAAGLILFELLTGEHPLAPVTITALTQVVLFHLPMPCAKDKRPDAGALSDIIDRCLRKPKEERYATANELCSALEGLLTDRAAHAISEDQCPFAGLSSFQEADAGKYFGRERDIAAVVGKLRHHEILAIAGPSGAGKSSFVRAGIFPALRRAQEHLEIRTVRPGRKPLAALANVVLSFTDSAHEEALDLQTVEKSILEQPGYLGLRLRDRCRRLGSEHKIILFVDQFEELYTLSLEAGVREAFTASLLGVADDASSPLRVIFAIRADFLDRLTEDRNILSAVTRGLYFLPAMGDQGLRDALEKPLAAAKYQFEGKKLVDEILDGLIGLKSPLPILQFMATKLWENRDESRRLLTTAAYRALGGVAGALSTHADAMLAAMSPIEQRITRTIFMRLVTPERTRAIVLFDELCALYADKSVVEHVLQRLSEARLIAIESSHEREGKTVELVHESLIERWEKLRHWLDENELDVQFRTELQSAATQWEKNGKANGFLWRSEAAQKAESWLTTRAKSGSLEITLKEVDYLNAVIGLSRQTRRRWQIAIAAFLTASTAIVVSVSVLAFEAKHAAKRADTLAARARAEALAARNATRLAAAREMQAEDPTKALILLREIEPGPVPRGWVELVLQTRYAGVAERVKSHANAVRDTRLSPDGRRMAAAVARNLEIENIDGSGEPMVFRGHEHSIDTIAWSHDGRRIASGARDNTVRVWNADGSGIPVVLTGPKKRVFSVDWSPDDQYIIAASSDGSVRIWKSDGSNEPVVVGPGTEMKANFVAWSPDGQRIAIGSSLGTLSLWDATGKTQQIVLQGLGAGIYWLAWSPDGNRIATGSVDNTARIWNASGIGEPLVLQGHQASVMCVKWSPDGQYLATGSSDKTIRLWKVGGSEAAVVLRGHEGSVMNIDWSSDGRRIISGSIDHEVRVWNTAHLTNHSVLVGHSAPVHYASFSPDTRRLASASADKTVRIWDLNKKNPMRILQGHEDSVLSVGFRHDGQRIASTSDDMTVRVWPIEEAAEPTVLRGHEAAVWDAIFTPDGRQIISTSDDATVRIWDIDEPRPPMILRGHERKAAGVALSPDGQTIASGSLDKTLRLWSSADGKPLRTFQGHGDGIWSVSWSPDGRRIISAGDDAAIRIWNADGMGAPLLLTGHRTFSSVHPQQAYATDGRRFVSASRDGSVRIWNADGTGESITLYSGDVGVNSATWSPDGKTIAATFDDNTIGLWTDLEIIEDPQDARLWKASNECLSIDVRQRLLGFAEEQLRVDLENCRRRVAEADRKQP